MIYKHALASRRLVPQTRNPHFIPHSPRASICNFRRVSGVSLKLHNSPNALLSLLSWVEEADKCDLSVGVPALASFADNPRKLLQLQSAEGGYEVRPQVGVSGFRIDLGVLDPKSPGRFILGVECDGATYHSGMTAIGFDMKSSIRVFQYAVSG